MAVAFVVLPVLVPLPAFFCGSGAVVAVLWNGMPRFGNTDAVCCYGQPIICCYYLTESNHFSNAGYVVRLLPILPVIRVLNCTDPLRLFIQSIFNLSLIY
jgi:hypothetical protein